MANKQKQEFDAALSRLIRQYTDDGLSHDDICDSLSWHLDLAASRTVESDRVQMQADD